MSECPQFAHRILREGQTGFVRGDFEGKYTAGRIIFLGPQRACQYRAQKISR